MLILVFLAGYPLLEAFNCSSLFNGSLSRAVFIDITWLPPLGILFVMRQKNCLWKKIVSWFYLASALIFTIYFMVFDKSAVLRHCEYVMAVYDNGPAAYVFYSIFCQSGMVLLIILPFIQIPAADDPVVKKNLRDIQPGTAAFVVPAYLTAMISMRLWDALPSVLCHFALFLAVLLLRILIRIRKI